MTFKQGHTPWNKGLTKETDERIRKVSETRNRLFRENLSKAISRETLHKLYWKAQLSQREIGEQLSCSRETIKDYMKKLGIKTRKRADGRAISLGMGIKPNLSPSPHIAYVLGVIKGDGTVWMSPRHYGYRVQLVVNHEVFASNFQKALKHIGLNPKLFPSKNWKGKRVYVVRACSRIFVEWYKSLAISDTEKILSNNAQSIKEFIRGFYESEGHFGKYEKRHISHIHRNWNLFIFNTNIEMLNLIQRLLKRFKFNCSLNGPYLRKNRKYKPQYRLNLLGGKKEQIRFLKVINPCIKNGGVNDIRQATFN